MKTFIFGFLGLFFLMWLCVPLVWSQGGIPQPFRIGGTITIDGIQITQSTDEGLRVKVTKLDGTDYSDANGDSPEDNDGLNTSNWYLIDVPIFSATSQPGGAKPDETAVIHVYLNQQKLVVTSPLNGRIAVGESGAHSQINLLASFAEKWSGLDTFNIKFTELYTDSLGNKKFQTLTAPYTGTFGLQMGEGNLVSDAEGCYLSLVSDDGTIKFCIKNISNISTLYFDKRKTDTFYTKGTGDFSITKDSKVFTGIAYLDVSKGTFKKDKSGEVISITLRGNIAGVSNETLIIRGSFGVVLTK
jgi:hypothetical protein